MSPPIDGDIAEDPSIRVPPTAEKFQTIHVVAYIVAAVIVRQYSGWQIGLSAGFGAFMVGQVLTALGCICHYLCLMEIWSAVPFSGGSYGLSRATLGFHLGFLDGCLEALVYVGHTALTALGIGTRMCQLLDSPPDQATVWALVTYVVALALCIRNNVTLLKRSFMALVVICVIILMIYLFGAMKYVNFQENASLHRAEPASNVANWFQGGWDGWIVILPWTLQPYAGIRSFTLLTAMTENPKVTLPRAVVAAFAVIILLNIIVVFVFVSQPGGIERTSVRGSSPMLVGWSLIFGTENDPNTSAKITAALQIPASFARVFAYLIPASVMLQAMGRSNLMPSIMRLKQSNDTSEALVWSTLFGMGFAVMLYYYPVIELFNLTVMATMITDCTFLYGYILLKTTYSTVPRNFVSPFGITGAIYAFCMYVLIFISAAFYQEDYFALKFFAGFLGILSLYYFCCARTSQTLNEEEDHVFFKMHVRNFNMRKKSPRRYACERRKRNNNKVAATAGGGVGAEGPEQYEKLPTGLDGSNGQNSTAGMDSNQVTSQGQGYFAESSKEQGDSTTRIHGYVKANIVDTNNSSRCSTREAALESNLVARSEAELGLVPDGQ